MAQDSPRPEGVGGGHCRCDDTVAAQAAGMMAAGSGRRRAGSQRSRRNVMEAGSSGQTSEALLPAVEGPPPSCWCPSSPLPRLPLSCQRLQGDSPSPRAGALGKPRTWPLHITVWAPPSPWCPSCPSSHLWPSFLFLTSLLAGTSEPGPGSCHWRPLPSLVPCSSGVHRSSFPRLGSPPAVCSSSKGDQHFPNRISSRAMDSGEIFDFSNKRRNQNNILVPFLPVNF
ncbi:PREDICTED: uncharacterized protein LOC106150089 isoform X1 [Chinchilla lanigera]|uniref:uncharacterized protein LOC106150089 isoform X1 n=1 Tax=Chinchilla lanigera TaxID=34839 RepID=UPI00069722DE|nr:PREDICTED: uncharacterized protein LOC106150089 isoform X1 [Chinchilla lanigera]